MIDTVKIYTFINKDLYDKICSNSLIKLCIDTKSNNVLYSITSDSLKGSYDSNLSVKVSLSDKYRIFNSYVLEVEGSFHKIIFGHNCFNGFYNLCSLFNNVIKLIENAYNISLPKLRHWFLQKIDIAVCYDLGNNINVQKYINNISQIKFPRRKMQFYENESIYSSGSTTTLKIYNKLMEFRKHDLIKFKNYKSFDLYSFEDKIKGYIRFECSIKKKKIVNIYNNNFVRCDRVLYSDFKNIWGEEFMKLLKFDNNSDVKKIIDKEKVKSVLFLNYSNLKASRLYNFYLAIKTDGYNRIRINGSKSSFYRNISDLRKLGIDFSQSTCLYSTEDIDFNPFSWQEIS